MNAQCNSSSCFACGLDNPSGLRLRFTDNGIDRVFTGFTIDRAHTGHPGKAHGGIVAAVLDEVAGVPLRAAGRLVRRSGRRTRAHAEIFTLHAGILAEADILFTDPPREVHDIESARHEFGWRLYD
jgi:hypothetical protein